MAAGKWIGGFLGFITAGPLGALAGFALGSLFDHGLDEVNKPGNVAITKDHFTILDALARAGDLTIDGKRTNVMVNRQADGANQVYYIDLTNMQTMLLSPAYYLQQNDIVYVMPNEKKKRQSTPTQNAFQSPTLWISILSLAATLTAIFIK